MKPKHMKQKQFMIKSHPAFLSALILGIVYMLIVLGLFIVKDNIQYVKAVPLLERQTVLVETYAPDNNIARKATKPLIPPILRDTLRNAPISVHDEFTSEISQYYIFIQQTNHLFMLIVIALTITFGVMYVWFL